MGLDQTPARRRRGATTAATALAVASASLFMLVIVAAMNGGSLFADESAAPVTAEHTGTAPARVERAEAEQTGAAPTGTDHRTTDPRRAAPPPGPDATTGPDRHVLEPAEPTSIIIPALAVDAGVMELGLLDDGTMQVPPHAPRPESRAGWFRHSPTPGELGPSVIVGHVDSDRHGASVFYDLGSLTAGDRVEVQRTDGRTAVFAVERVAQYDKDEFPTDDVYGNLDHAGLRLITCGGVFDRASSAYEDNIVVYARFVTSHTTPGHEQP